MRPHPRLQPATSWACSSVVEHCVDIAGVASSILATPTIIRCDCNTQTGLAAIDGRACLLCGPEAPTFGRCQNAKKSAPRNEFMSYPLESRFRKRSPRGGGTFHRYRHCRRTGLASTRSEEHTSELQSLMRISYAH